MSLIDYMDVKNMIVIDLFYINWFSKKIKKYKNICFL